MALLPFAWLAWQRRTSQVVVHDEWWLAGVYGASWVADLGSQWLDPNVVGNIYPIAQTALVGLVVLDRRRADALLTFLLLVAVATVFWKGAAGFDVLIRTVAWLGIAGMAWGTVELNRFRWWLLVTFGLGWATWLPYAALPSWGTWEVYQTLRAASIPLFWWATLGPTLHLEGL